MQKLYFFLVLCLALILPPAVNAASHAFLWTATSGMQDLGTLGGSYCAATGINNSGQVVGYSYLPGDTVFHPFIWTARDGMVDLGLPEGVSSLQGVAINSRGHIIASILDAQGEFLSYFWSSDKGFIPISLGAGVGIRAAGINDFDEVTGTEDPPTGATTAFIWQLFGRQLRSLGTYPGGTFTQGAAINNLGHVVANGNITALSRPAGDPPYNFVLQFQKGRGWRFLGGADFSTFPTANNNKDEVVGFTFDIFSTDKAIYFNGPGGSIMQPLQYSFAAHALAINESGIIAGISFGNSGPTHAVIWPKYYVAPQDIGTLGGASATAMAINDFGQVVGTSEVP